MNLQISLKCFRMDGHTVFGLLILTGLCFLTGLTSVLSAPTTNIPNTQGENAAIQDCMYGPNCSRECHCAPNDTCDNTTGECEGPCAPGWAGSTCQQECPDQRYGQGCTLVCACKNRTEACDKVNGTCISGPLGDLDKEYETIGIIIASGVGLLYLLMFIALAVCCTRK